LERLAKWRYRHALYLLFQLSQLFLTEINVAWSQGAKGGITGSLLDNSGASIVGAAVTSTNLDTGLTRTTVTKSDGVFLIPLLDPGRYRSSNIFLRVSSSRNIGMTCSQFREVASVSNRRVVILIAAVTARFR
jgi:hypothetical protein